jgi:hypothetical protein
VRWNEGTPGGGTRIAGWTSAWRTGLPAWTTEVNDLVGAWVRRAREDRDAGEWWSRAEIELADDTDLSIWLPSWPEWRTPPRRPGRAAEGPAMHPGPTRPGAFVDERFKDTKGPCADAPGGLVAAAKRYEAGLRQIEAVHIVDRGDVRHYLHVWGESEWNGKSNLLPQASVVFVKGEGAALDAFYKWMRHVELPIYPVLHDVEWAQEQDDLPYVVAEIRAGRRVPAYQADACGHPSLLVSPAAGVAVGAVFGDDLAAIRQVLTRQFGRPTTEGETREWVPALAEPYDHVLALAAGWAVADPRVGWRGWVARRPFKWKANLYKAFRHSTWPEVLRTRRWDVGTFNQWYVPTDDRREEGRDYETDSLARVPYVRGLFAVVENSFSASYEHRLSAGYVRDILGDGSCGEIELRSMDGRADTFVMKDPRSSTLYADASERLLSPITSESCAYGVGIAVPARGDASRLQKEHYVWQNMLISKGFAAGPLCVRGRDDLCSALSELLRRLTDCTVQCSGSAILLGDWAVAIIEPAGFIRLAAGPLLFPGHFPGVDTWYSMLGVFRSILLGAPHCCLSLGEQLERIKANLRADADWIPGIDPTSASDLVVGLCAELPPSILNRRDLLLSLRSLGAGYGALPGIYIGSRDSKDEKAPSWRGYWYDNGAPLPGADILKYIVRWTKRRLVELAGVADSSERTT